MAGPDLSLLVSSVNFGTVTVAILAVFAALVVVLVAWKGARMVLMAVSGRVDVYKWDGNTDVETAAERLERYKREGVVKVV